MRSKGSSRPSGFAWLSPGQRLAALCLATRHVIHASVLYSRRLAHMRYDPLAWLCDEPGDGNLWRRIVATGAQIAHLAAPVAVHFREGSMVAGRQHPVDWDTILPEVAADVLDGPGRDLLAVGATRSGEAPH